MAMPDISVPPYPDVPVAPGVPPVARDPSGAATANSNLIVGDSLFTGDSPSIGAASLSPLDSHQWAILGSDGSPVIDPDSFIRVENLREFRVADAPTENGGFQSYNKVQTPFAVKVTVAKGGEPDERGFFLANLDTVIESLDLLSVIVPERSYDNLNLDHYSLARQYDQGVELLKVDLWFVEIRISATEAFSDTASPSGSHPQNGGAVQATPPTSDQSAAASGGTT